jgi:pimeloyl-ACP methyl ester carboxylesterase
MEKGSDAAGSEPMVGGSVSLVEGIVFERVGGGDPLLLLHGTGGSRQHWRPVVGLLAAEREVLVVDLPGHGASPGPPEGIAHTPIGYAEMLARALDRLGLAVVDVAGNSVGGWTALELAKLGRARTVVAIGPAGLWAKRDPWRCVFALWSQHKMGRAFGWAAPPLLRNTAGRALLMGGTVGRPGQMPAEDAIEMAATYARTPGFGKHLAQTRRARFSGGAALDVPVCLAWGEKDRLLPAKARLTGELPDAARQVTLPGCGHLPMWDDPDLVARTILEQGRVRW